MKEIELKVTIDEANVILEGLGNLPFARVYELVGRLQAQAAQQLDETQQPPGVTPLNKQNVAE